MAMVKAATRLGISTKRFSGWEPKQTTTVLEWDEQGRPSKWVTETESEWEADEQDNVLALLEHEADSCPGCGQPLSESAHPDADPDNPERKYKYQASNPIVCHSCGVHDKAQKRHRKQNKGRDVPTPLFVTRKVDLPPVVR